MENLKRVVLVTGLSGAGKTTAMGVLEDMGYFCIDRYPVELVQPFVEMIEHSTLPKYVNIAMSVNSMDFQNFYNAFRLLSCELKVLYLDADKDALLLRYKYNRRTHPLLVNNQVNTLEEAIIIERNEFENIRELATVRIDTTHLSGQDLRKKIIRYFSVSLKPSFTISFISFGYRYGLPLDADLVLDVRFLANPYWEESLRDLTGNDESVFDYVVSHEQTQEYLNYLVPFLDYSLAQYQKEGKSHFTIAIGCTGGQHRSVSIVNWLYQNYQEKFTCFKEHRDTEEE